MKNTQQLLRYLNTAAQFKAGFDDEPLRVWTKTGSRLEHSSLYLSAGDCLDAPYYLPTGKQTDGLGAYVGREL